MVRGIKKELAKEAVQETVTVKQAEPAVWEPIIVNHKLDDVQLYADQFDGRPEGRYTMTFQTPFSSQSLSVYWNGESVSL